jgi:RinA family phage transcriptional activator
LKISRGAFHHVENELLAYKETKKEIERLKADILYGRASHDENVGGGRSSLPSDPTGQTATLLVSHKSLQHMERVVDAIDSVYKGLDKSKKQLVQLKYWARPQTLTWDGIALELHVSRITAIRWRDETIQAIAYLIGWR